MTQARARFLATAAWARGWQLPAVAPVNPAVPRTFGSTSEAAHVISATEFESQASGDGWILYPSPAPLAGLIRASGALVTYWAGVHLPTGALITRIELDGIDETAVRELISFVYRLTSPAGGTPPLVLAGVATGVAPMPGAALFPYVLNPGLTPADLTMDNTGHYYVIGLATGAGLGFSNVRVFYRLQASPAPGVATFGDVPTSHPFFQFIEALAASGITAGCGGGNYCPDAPLTRGQMAVFLTKALGLHFAP